MATPRKSRSRAAFSLLELVLVLALCAFLGAVALRGYASMTQATALATGAERLQEALAEARQAAVTQNITVEMRFYAVPAPSGGGAAYSTVQAHELKTGGVVSPLTPAVALPSTVTIDSTPAHSPLLATNTEVPTADAADPLLNSQTRVFHFLPDGSTDLDPTSAWFLTLRAATASDPAHFPSNWACLALDPATGRVQIYRP